MSNVINLANYRHKCRKSYVAKYGARLDRLIERFVTTNLDFDFRQITGEYQSAFEGVSLNGASSAGSWDYVHFREILAEALDEVFGTVVYEQLLKEHWFDERMITREEVIDRCLSAYVMRHCDYAIVSPEY